MNALLDKLARLEREISEEKGPFTFYALLKPATSIGEWDYVVSASWCDPDICGAIAYIAPKLRAACTDEEMCKFSGIVVIETYHPDLEDLLEDFEVEHGMLKMRYSHYFNQEFQRGYIITARRARQPA